MKIIKQINNSAALAIDNDGNELIVFGRGIGYGKIPYELTDLSKIERTFYDVDPKYVSMISQIPQKILAVSMATAEQAERELDCDLNPNLPFTLADHLSFSVERVQKGIELTTPLAYDVAHLYPLEYALGCITLKAVKDQIGVQMPESEAVSIAMHLINAEAENGDMHFTMMATCIIADIDTIITRQLGVQLDLQSYSYARFTMHLRYLVQRIANGERMEIAVGGMLRELSREYPEIYRCTQQIVQYFREKWNWDCSNEEIVYLMMHINRLREKNGG